MLEFSQDIASKSTSYFQYCPLLIATTYINVTYSITVHIANEIVIASLYLYSDLLDLIMVFNKSSEELT